MAKCSVRLKDYKSKRSGYSEILDSGAVQALCEADLLEDVFPLISRDGAGLLGGADDVLAAVEDDLDVGAVADEQLARRFRIVEGGFDVDRAGLLLDGRDVGRDAFDLAREMFARQGLVPVIKGNGSRVVRQTPEPGVRWAGKDSAPTSCVLWLSEQE